MSFVSEFKEKIFQINENNFEKKAIDVFKFQAIHNVVYKKYIQYLSINIDKVDNISKIPFLPIQFFKSQEVKSVNSLPETYFESSGTTGMNRSKHLVFDIDFYHQVTLNNFEYFFGKITDYEFLALLPNYLENPHSSLISMVEYFIQKSGNNFSGFYNDVELRNILATKSNKKRLLIGVSFALLDFCEGELIDNNNIIVMETGGMKGRRKEMIRSELHADLQKGFAIEQVSSEYGMSELLSQSYSFKEGIFNTPPWKRIILRDTDDPFLFKNSGRGGINVIDLANVETCSFIETQDLGKLNKDGSFEVLGRFDNSDVRGCNLMAL